MRTKVGSEEGIWKSVHRDAQCRKDIGWRCPIKIPLLLLLRIDKGSHGVICTLSFMDICFILQSIYSF